MRTLFRLFLPLLVLFCLVNTLDAGKKRKKRPDKKKAAMYNKFDKDGDGKHNSEEDRAYKKAKYHSYLLSRYDKDKDGKLSDIENEAIEADRQKKFLARYDINGDGKVSDEEKSEVDAKRKADFLKKYDLNNDGKVSDSEKRSVKKGHVKKKINDSRIDSDESDKKVPQKTETEDDFGDFIPPPPE